MPGRIVRCIPTRLRSAMSSPAAAKDAAPTCPRSSQSPCETYDRVEIPEIKPDVTQVSLHGGVCPCCAKRFKAEPPEGLEPGSPFGPNLRAFVIYLRSVQGIPLARLSHLLRDLFGLDISEGALVNILNASREPFAAQTSLIKARLVAGHGAGFGRDRDEGRQGQLVALGVPSRRQRRLHRRQTPHPRQSWQAFLGDWRPDYWISDRYGGQMGWAVREHQVCLAHLIRDVQYAIDAGDAVFAPGLKGLLKRACAIGRRRDRSYRRHAQNLRGRSQPAARSPHEPDADPQGRNKLQTDHQKGPQPSLRLRDQPRPHGDQQRLGEGPAPLRGLSKNHQRLSQRMGRHALRRHPIRRRNRPPKINPRNRRYPPHPPRSVNPPPTLTHANAIRPEQLLYC